MEQRKLASKTSGNSEMKNEWIEFCRKLKKLKRVI